jgi:uncharacterized protein
MGYAATAMSKVLTRAWKLPPRRVAVTVERDIKIPMPDGTVLLADHYVPAGGTAGAPTVLIRCPYGRGGPFGITALLTAGRGYHVLMQSCRGTSGSAGAFEPMRNEIADGRDTMAWLREQDWFNGRLATLGMSYLGFVQWALALDPPPELAAAVIEVAPHDFSRSAYHNGAFDLYNFLSWSEMMAHQDDTGAISGLARMLTTERRLRPALDGLPVTSAARELLGEGAPWFESWLEHPDLSDPFWEPLQCGDALQKITAPVLITGGWHDLFIEQSLEQYRVLRDRGVPVRLVIGPWAHRDLVTKGGVAVAEALTWLDRCLHGPEPEGHSVRVWVGGAGEWRDLPDWPDQAKPGHVWHLAANGMLVAGEAGGAEEAGTGGLNLGFRYDPADPTPSPGGAVMAAKAGARDNRQVEQRPDVLTFTTDPLSQPVEVIGGVAAEISATRDNENADLFVRLCDVQPGGRSVNVCDGITRLTAKDPLSGVTTVPMAGAAHRFLAGHRLRLQVSGGAHPRFARNPGTGGVEASAADLVQTRYRIDSGRLVTA